MDSLLDGELNTHHDNRMVASPPPTAKKEMRSQRCPCLERHEGWPAGDYFAIEFTVVQSLRQQFFDAGTGIVHSKEIP